MIKLNKAPRDKNGRRHGYWEVYYSNDSGDLWYKGYYIHGKKYGYYGEYYPNGKLFCKGNFIHGKKHGYWEQYYSTGLLSYKGYWCGDRLIRGVHLTTKNKLLL